MTQSRRIHPRFILSLILALAVVAGLAAPGPSFVGNELLNRPLPHAGPNA